MTDTRTRSSTRLWSQEVALAEAQAGREEAPPGQSNVAALLKAREPAYDFSNGRSFTKKGPYE